MDNSKVEVGWGRGRGRWSAGMHSSHQDHLPQWCPPRVVAHASCFRLPNCPGCACVGCWLQAVDEAVSKKQKFAFLLTTRSGRQLFLACETAAQSEHVRRACSPRRMWLYRVKLTLRWAGKVADAAVLCGRGGGVGLDTAPTTNFYFVEGWPQRPLVPPRNPTAPPSLPPLFSDSQWKLALRLAPYEYVRAVRSAPWGAPLGSGGQPFGCRPTNR